MNTSGVGPKGPGGGEPTEPTRPKEPTAPAGEPTAPTGGRYSTNLKSALLEAREVLMRIKNGQKLKSPTALKALAKTINANAHKSPDKALAHTIANALGGEAPTAPTANTILNQINTLLNKWH